MDVSADVVVVGGGIAGAAFAKVAAEAGLRVTVLERQMTYRDKVRGEVLSTWGVLEARRLGVEEVLTAAGVPGRRNSLPTTKTYLPLTPPPPPFPRPPSTRRCRALFP